MIVSLPTPDGPEMMTIIAPGAPSRTKSGRPGSSETWAGSTRSVSSWSVIGRWLALAGRR